MNKKLQAIIMLSFIVFAVIWMKPVSAYYSSSVLSPASLHVTIVEGSYGTYIHLEETLTDARGFHGGGVWYPITTNDANYTNLTTTGEFHKDHNYILYSLSTVPEGNIHGGCCC
jgi:hypothetical protein